MSKKLDADFEYVRSRYQKRIAVDGTTFKSMNSGTEEKQKLRHSIHSEIIKPGASVLDLGCGIGQFYENLKSSGIPFSYTGIDIVPEYIEHCKKNFPDAKFLLRNIFTDGIPGTYDVVIASQVFNAKFPNSDNFEIMKSFISLAFASSKYAISFDALTSYCDFFAPELFYYEPEKVFGFCKGLSRLVKLRHDYLPFEFTTQVFVAGKLEPK